MPCDTITTQSINLSRALPPVLLQALESDGWTIDEKTETKINAHKGNASLTWTAGRGLSVQHSSPQQYLDSITRAYSAKAVSWAAQRAGWTVKQNADQTITVNRR
jgi:hypothetical protein